MNFRGLYVHDVVWSHKDRACMHAHTCINARWNTNLSLTESRITWVYVHRSIDKKKDYFTCVKARGQGKEESTKVQVGGLNKLIVDSFLEFELLWACKGDKWRPQTYKVKLCADECLCLPVHVGIHLLHERKSLTFLVTRVCRSLQVLYTNTSRVGCMRVCWSYGCYTQAHTHTHIHTDARTRVTYMHACIHTHNHVYYQVAATHVSRMQEKITPQNWERMFPPNRYPQNKKNKYAIYLHICLHVFVWCMYVCNTCHFGSIC